MMLIELANATNPKPTLTLLHISNSKNYKSILTKGLLVGKKSSGYGIKPKHKAIYLYHENNINMVYDMINTFDEFDIWEVCLSESDKQQLIADEDSNKTNWEDSINTFGTCAITKSVPPNQVKHLMRCGKVN